MFNELYPFIPRVLFVCASTLYNDHVEGKLLIGDLLADRTHVVALLLDGRGRILVLEEHPYRPAADLPAYRLLEVGGEGRLVIANLADDPLGGTRIEGLVGLARRRCRARAGGAAARSSCGPAGGARSSLP